MFRVFLVPTAKHPHKELWLEAVTVRESPSGRFWEFFNVDGLIVGRIDKDRVTGFEQATDRRKSTRPMQGNTAQEIPDRRVSDPTAKWHVPG